MPRKFTEGRLILATHNQGKVAEIGRLLSSYVPDVVSAADLGLSEPEETGVTFAENAILKAQAAARESGQIVLADDSGLAVYALGGAPGIYSARWAGIEKNFQKAMREVHDRLGDSSDRSAAFICVLALAWPDGHVETAEGRCEGGIVWPPRGDAGFGYDPFFIPVGADRTFGEMSKDEKQSFSHRASAFSSLIKNCFE
ncbi:MAG: non-canonical purine NTP pyrophosphatase, RdgB/HAM1 family [Alphaproteobacteria bacterium CG_4_9_14_3_um_filter_47_13]|nr:MAG: non-canonical purine NTP pyrophosphatase, RdgB/HAM1 family [Alphaproteobacteria bacterium CG_4_9_14_3_um_filter_47_13]